MIDLNTLSIPPVDKVPEPTAAEWAVLRKFFDTWGHCRIEIVTERRLFAGLARRCRELERDLKSMTDLNKLVIDDYGRSEARVRDLERSLEAMKAGFLEIQDEYAALEAQTPVHLSTKLSWANHRIAELEAEVERLKNKKCVHDLAKEWSQETTSGY